MNILSHSKQVYRYACRTKHVNIIIHKKTGSPTKVIKFKEAFTIILKNIFYKPAHFCDTAERKMSLQQEKVYLTPGQQIVSNLCFRYYKNVKQDKKDNRTTAANCYHCMTYRHRVTLKTEHKGTLKKKAACMHYKHTDLLLIP